MKEGMTDGRMEEKWIQGYKRSQRNQRRFTLLFLQTNTLCYELYLLFIKTKTSYMNHHLFFFQKRKKEEEACVCVFK